MRKEGEPSSLALIGKGRWGENYINTIGSLAEINLPPEFIKTRDYRELFSYPEVDGVIIASPTNTHFQIAEEFLIRDFNILIEKPVTTTYEEALALQRLHGQHREAVVMAGHIQIYDPGYQKLKESLPMVGKVREMTFRGLQSPLRSDSTLLENWGPHPIYLFIDLVGKNPIAASGKETVDDNIHLEFGFDSRVKGIADIGSVSAEKKRELTVIGSKGSLTLDWSKPEKTLAYFDPDQIKTNLSFRTDLSPLALEVLEFVECIKTGQKPKTPLNQGVNVMEIIEALKRSVAEGGKEIEIH